MKNLRSGYIPSLHRFATGTLRNCTRSVSRSSCDILQLITMGIIRRQSWLVYLVAYNSLSMKCMVTSSCVIILQLPATALQLSRAIIQQSHPVVPWLQATTQLCVHNHTNPRNKLPQWSLLKCDHWRCDSKDQPFAHYYCWYFQSTLVARA